MKVKSNRETNGRNKRKIEKGAQLLSTLLKSYYDKMSMSPYFWTNIPRAIAGNMYL